MSFPEFQDSDDEGVPRAWEPMKLTKRRTTLHSSPSPRGCPATRIDLPHLMASSSPSCRKCSHCGGNGHNSRTCPDQRGGVKLFGVRMTSTSASGSMRKSASTGNLVDTAPPPSCVAARQDGYASEGHLHTSRQRRKGVPWSEEEHKLFLLALRELGKGDWRGISKRFVKTRTPTQVASHAQKYFLRQSNLSKRRRRSSLFDMVPDVVADDVAQETLQNPSCLPHECSAAKDASLTREAPSPDDVDASPTCTKAQVDSGASDDFLWKYGMPLSESRQPLYPSPYMHFPGWRYPHCLDPAFFFYYTSPRLQGFPYLAHSWTSESKIVRPIPRMPTTIAKDNALADPSEPHNGKACPVIECTLVEKSKIVRPIPRMPLSVRDNASAEPSEPRNGKACPVIERTFHSLACAI